MKKVFRLLTAKILVLAVPTLLVAEDTANRTLLGNQAVRKELQLTVEQTKQIDALLAEMEKEIAAGLEAAKKKGGDEVDEDQIVPPIVSKFGQRAQEVLDEKQKTRVWEIGAQQSGAAVFANNRTKRVLRLTVDQSQQMEALQKKSHEELMQRATDPATDLRALQAAAEQAQVKLYNGCLKLLTDEQRKELAELLGKPFDSDLLTNSAGEKPRALTFIFGATWHNSHVLLTDPKVQQELGITEEQRKTLDGLLTREDKALTEVRLGILKKLDRDFRELPDAEKPRVVRSILDGANDVFSKTNKEISSKLSEQQLEGLDRRLVKLIGARALGCQRVAERLKLTPEQKQAYAKATLEFEQQTAGMRVVRTHKDFDARTFDERLSGLDKSIRALLSPAQVAELEKLEK